MNVPSKNIFHDDWLAKALIYYQIIDQRLYEELRQRFSDEDYIFDVLVNNNYLQPEDIALFVENALKIPTVNLEKIDIDPKLTDLIPEDVCRKFLLIPINMSDKNISIACFNPSNLDAENEIEYVSGKYVKTFFAFKDQVLQKISEYYNPDKIIDSLVDNQKSRSIVRIPGEESEDGSSSVVKLINQLLADAIDGQASDVHIEPKENGIVARFRIDGVLRNILEVPKAILPTLISRIKILSSMNIAETRKPQDGKAKISVDDADIDLRVSILPTSFGEKAVIRILDKRQAAVSFEQMGIRGFNKTLLEKSFKFKQGMVLVTGPTGSGKSTTLYAAINRIRSTTNNILTIEDPIEYMMEGINQVQVNAKAGITFAAALRSFLRQDPDVILVGEIRDKETAEIAIQAALTGHLVLSTLHTNDTFTTVTRLKDMGIDRFKISESVQAIVAQRLVRRICDNCKTEIPAESIDPQLARLIEQIGYEARVHEAKGCSQCNYSGYKGRIGIYEILLLDGQIKDAINSDSPVGIIRATARKNGFRNLFEDALSLVAEGITDYKEVLRVVHPGFSEENNNTKAAPAAEETAAKSEKPAQQQSSPADGSETKQPNTDKSAKQDNGEMDVLIVEDYKTTRMMLKRMIENQAGWKVREAVDGLKALEEVEKKHPDIILLDIMMPNMDGYEFLQHLRSERATEKIPVLILTSLKTVESEIKGFRFGADDFLTKPINMELLIARIKRYAGRIDTSAVTVSEDKEENSPQPGPSVAPVKSFKLAE